MIGLFLSMRKKTNIKMRTVIVKVFVLECMK